MYSVHLSRSARRFYERADTRLRRRLAQCFAQLAADPRRYPNIKRLHGEFAGLYRVRVGDYRVLFSIDDDVRIVLVELVEHRSSVYE